MAELRVIPLGGLGAIGGNCLVLEHQDDLVVVDCGISFNDPVYGVDVVVPDLTYVRERAHRVRAILITHGHEDHIGALPYLVDTVRCPVYAPPYALELVRHRLAEHHLEDSTDLRELALHTRYGAGCFQFESVPVEHSIPQSRLLVIDTPQGVVVHTGDYRWSSVVQSESPQRAALDAVGARQPRLLLADSTNILRAGHTVDEQAVARGLERWLTSTRGRIVFTTFVSNIERLQSVVTLARATARHVCLLGRSTLTHTRIARDLGLLDLRDQDLVAPKVAASLPPSQLLVICGGSQGEPHSALARLARGEHTDLELSPGDRVILSSRSIPGNEQRIINLIDQFERRGVEAVHQELDPAIHTSGHGYREEMRAMLEVLAPQCMIPVHGRYQYLRLHAELAQSCHVAQTLVASDGDVIELGETGLTRTGTVPLQSLYLSAGKPLPLDAVRERVLMARGGLVVCNVVFEPGRALHSPRVSVHGLCSAVGKAELNMRAAQWLEKRLRAELDGRTLRAMAADEVQAEVKRLLRRFFSDELGLRPVIDIALQQR